MMRFLNYSLSLSLAARRDNNIIKKFHKTSKIKNRESIDEEMEMSRGGWVDIQSKFLTSNQNIDNYFRMF